MNDNCITHIESETFSKLLKLRSLNMSSNPVLYLPGCFLGSSLHISEITLVNMTFGELSHEALEAVLLDTIVTDDYGLCCFSPPDSKCTATFPWHTSCTDILPNTEMRASFIVVSILALISNGLSVMMSLLSKQLSKSYTITLVFVNMSDALLVPYLSCLWVAYIIWRGILSVKEEIWRRGTVCCIAFAVVLWHTLCSQCLLFLFSFSRLRVVVAPIDTEFKRTSFVRKILISVLMLSLFVCFSLTLSVKFATNILPSALCFPFWDPGDKGTAILFLIWLCVITQTLTSIGITGMHVSLVKHLLDSQRNITKSNTDRTSNTLLIVQLSFTTASLLLCWFPGNAVYLSAMFLEQQSY